MPNLLKLPNFYAFVAVFIVGCLAVTGIYTAGQRAERNKTAAEMAPINTSIVADRGKDEAEIASDAKDAAKIDAAVKAALNARFILDEDTAKLLGSVK
jgi:hypothetical protein